MSWPRPEFLEIFLENKGDLAFLLSRNFCGKKGLPTEKLERKEKRSGAFCLHLGTSRARCRRAIIGICLCVAQEPLWGCTDVYAGGLHPGGPDAQLQWPRGWVMTNARVLGTQWSEFSARKNAFFLETFLEITGCVSGKHF